MSAREMASRHFRAMQGGDIDLARAAIHPMHINHEAPDHPPASARPGPPGFLATSAWLRSAFDDLEFQILEIVHDDQHTIAHVIMSGRQTGPFVLFPLDRTPVSFPPTGRSFAVRQCHIFGRRDGLHTDHRAVRDDLAMMQQLGHLPPTPASALRMTRWRLSGKHRQAVRRAVDLAEHAANSCAVTPTPGNDLITS